MSNKSSHLPDETAPLLNGGTSSGAHGHAHNANGNGNGHLHVRHGTGALMFFFDSKRTPGLENENIVLRSLAYMWHVTKITLLSSTFCAAPKLYLSTPGAPHELHAYVAIQNHG